VRTTNAEITEMKRRGEKIVMLTCYDYPTAVWEDEAGVDIVFVGDSVGTNVLGYESEKEVTLDDMIHHLKAVRRGVRRAYLLVDLPYLTYETPEEALRNATHLISNGADGVKLEGFRPDIVRHLVENGIDLCAHLGLNPQIHEKKGLRAKTAKSAESLISESIALQEAGAWIMVYELIPEEVAGEATRRLSIPTIGIGAGRRTDGQVLIVSDMLGINEFELRHVRKYDNLHERATQAIRRHVVEVRSSEFPSSEHVRHLGDEESKALEEMLSTAGATATARARTHG
jgi:3-methyl-2-oxobutanoate hydroxymethyltransferase